MPSSRTIYLLSRAHYAIRRKIDARLAAHGVTAVTYTVMSMVRGKKPLSSAEIARRYCVTPQAMNEIVLSLERNGWVSKEPNPENRRVRFVSLTAKGRELLERCDAIVDRIEAEVFADLDRAGVDLLRNALHSVMAAAMGPPEQR